MMIGRVNTASKAANTVQFLACYHSGSDSSGSVNAVYTHVCRRMEAQSVMLVKLLQTYTVTVV